MLLRDPIVARVMAVIAITGGRAARHPRNVARALRDNGPARAGPAAVAFHPREQAAAALAAACDMECP